MRKVSKSESGCWEWTAGKKGGGYGVFFLDGKLRGAHRAALLLFKGLHIETPLDAMHSCDNPGCVNPAHISYGSRSENMIDASIKGRVVRVQDWRGELNPKAKLSGAQAREIVDQVLSNATRADVARRYGVTPERVSQILIAAGHSCEHSATDVAAAVRRAKTHCKRGHSLAGDNLRINTGGGRVCRECVRIYNAARERVRKAQ
ncbi:hypothetical protein [Massilia brevitalea]|uniref:hypothetical protein n=1 Tax=Massilia brevitalea TaxID=442526 RepID=UPI002739A3FB|nr:hypothetical protein [Massilia brevitalea]